MEKKKGGGGKQQMNNITTTLVNLLLCKLLELLVKLALAEKWPWKRSQRLYHLDQNNCHSTSHKHWQLHASSRDKATRFKNTEHRLMWGLTPNPQTAEGLEGLRICGTTKPPPVLHAFHHHSLIL